MRRDMCERALIFIDSKMWVFHAAWAAHFFVSGTDELLELLTF